MNSYDNLIEKWSPVLNEESAGEIKDHHRKAVTAAILENQERALAEERNMQQGFLTEAPCGCKHIVYRYMGSNFDLSCSPCNA